MIERGEFCHNGTAYDSRLSCSDFRFSAAAVGMLKFLADRHECSIEILEKERIGSENGVEYFYYNLAEVCGENAEEAYLRFAEKYFAESMHHTLVEKLLKKETLSEEEIKQVNDKLSANSIMKKVFGKEKYSEENREKLLGLLEENRLEIIRQTYANGMSMYRNFSNPNCLGNADGNVCRLNGFYVDMGKKKKSVGFFQNHNTANVADAPEFDYVPFAFTKSRISYFVNNNCSLAECRKLNFRWLQEKLQGSDDERSARCLRMIHKLAKYLKYSVEVIEKRRENEFFTTVYLRKKALQVLDKVQDEWLDAFEWACNVSGEFVNADEIVLDHIVNGVYLDDFIDRLLKDDGRQSHGALINRLLYVNMLLKDAEGEDMNKKMGSAFRAARAVTGNLEENKLNAYRQKLLSSIIAHDYDRFKEILLQLSVYAGVEFGFAFDLFDDFEENKDVAYTFINTLGMRAAEAQKD